MSARGTYYVLKNAYQYINSFGFSGNAADIDFAFAEAFLRLDTLIESSYQCIGETKWINGLHTARRLASTISAHSLVNLTQRLESINHHIKKSDFCA